MKTIGIDGANLVYQDTGPPAEGAPTLLLVHGFPLSHAMWKAQVEGLAPTCRVVAPDLRGYGESTLGGWPADGEEPSLDRNADDLAALIDELKADGPMVLAGFSMGGYIAFTMLRRHAAKLDALVLIDTKASADDEPGRATRLKMAEKINEWGAARVAELMRPKLFAEGTPDTEVQATIDVISATNPASISASQLAMAARPDSTGLLASIKMPTLVIVGEEDALTTAEEMREIANAISNSRYAEIAGAGHMAPVEQPEAVNDTLREFIESL